MYSRKSGKQKVILAFTIVTRGESIDPQGNVTVWNRTNRRETEK